MKKEKEEIAFLSDGSLSYSSSDLQVDLGIISDDDNKKPPSPSSSTIIESNAVQIAPCCDLGKCTIS